MEQIEMIAKVEEWLYELPPNKFLDDAVLREALLSPERIMAIYLVKSGIIEKAQKYILDQVKSRLFPCGLEHSRLLMANDVKELYKIVEYINGKEN